MNLETASANFRTMDEAIKHANVTDQYNGESVEAKVLTEGAIASASKNVGTKDEAVAVADINDQYN